MSENTLRDKIIRKLESPPVTGRTKDYAGMVDFTRLSGQILNLLKEELEGLTVIDGDALDELLQKMLGEVPQLRRLWTWKDDDGTLLQDNIKLGIVFDLIEHLLSHTIKELKDKMK